MSKIEKIQPVKRTNFSEIAIGDKRQIHADSLATFKSNLSRFKSKNGFTDTYKFEYTSFGNDIFCTATRIS